MNSSLEIAADSIVYVSCNSATMAHDLQLFHEGGYSVGSIQPVDLFPQTLHVESIVALTRNK